MASIENFTWGKVLKVHEIGEYKIVEYDEYEHTHTKVLTGCIRFHAFLGERDLRRCSHTLDEAIILAIASKYEEDRAVPYIMKMLGQ